MNARATNAAWWLLPLMSAAACSSEAPSTDSPSRSAAPAALLHRDQPLRAAFRRTNEVRVLVTLRDPDPRRKGTRHSRRDAIERVQQALLNEHAEGFTLKRRYAYVPAVAATITQDELARLRADPNVEEVTLDHPGGGQLAEAVKATGGEQARDLYGLTGRGVTVAVLDTGIDTDHTDLSSSVLAQHCFTSRACPPYRSSEGDSAEDDHGHGSHVTGVIASDGNMAPRGFAPEADIVAVKVNDSYNSGYESDWVAGLDWVYANLSELDVQIVNLSLGTTQMSQDSPCDSRHSPLARAIDNLVEAGVVVFAASGNSGTTDRLPAPACTSGPITVGATYDGTLGRQPPDADTYYQRFGGYFARCGDPATAFDQVTCFTNSTERLDLVAPGARIVGPAPFIGLDTYSGTSQAAPAAAGAAALMLECNPMLTPTEIRDILASTGETVVDERNGLSLPSLRVLEAVEAACPDLLDPGADGGVGDGGTMTEGGVGDGGTTTGGDAGTVADGGTTTGGEAGMPDANGQPDPGLDAGGAAGGGSTTGGTGFASGGGPGSSTSSTAWDPGASTATPPGSRGVGAGGGSGCSAALPGPGHTGGLPALWALAAAFGLRRRRALRADG